MRANLFPSQNEELLKKQLRDIFKISESYQIRICKGLSHALTDISRGLVSLYPHRTNIGYQLDGGPYFYPLLPYFSREGITLTSIKGSDFKKGQALTHISKSSLFYLLADDDPLLGCQYNWLEFENELAQQKIFAIRISFNSFFFSKEPLTVSPYTIRILSLHDDLSVLIIGEKVKTESLVPGPIHYPNSIEIPKAHDNKSSVLEFESCFHTGLKPYFKTEALRLYDRAVVFAEDVEGSALGEEFSELVGQNLFAQNLIETSSLCRWDQSYSMDWLLQRGLNEEQIRGLLVIDSSLLNKKNAEALNCAYQNIKSKQEDTP